jgi:hypothetical protein
VTATSRRGDRYVGYLDEYPDYTTQGETIEEFEAMHGDVLLPDDVSLAELGALHFALYNTGHVVTQHMAHRILYRYRFHSQSSHYTVV